jgi:hypothetical protein
MLAMQREVTGRPEKSREEFSAQKARPPRHQGEAGLASAAHFRQALLMSKFALLTASLFSGVSVLAADRVLHSFERLTLTTEFWSEGAGSGDFNRDGKLDVVSGPYWYAGPDFQKRHEFYLATQTHTNKGNGGPDVRRGWSPRVY